MDEKTEVKQTLAPHMRPMKPLFWVLGGVVIFAIILCIGLSHAWHEHNHFGKGMMMGPIGQDGFYKQFGGMGFRGGYMMNSSVTGSISKIAGNELTITAVNGIAETVTVDAQTFIGKAGAAIKVTDLKTGDSVTVFGLPNGINQIEAKTIFVQ